MVGMSGEMGFGGGGRGRGREGFGEGKDLGFLHLVFVVLHGCD